MLKAINISIDDEFLSINLVDRTSLQNATFSLSNHSKKTIKGYTYYNNNQYVINILWGLNRIEFEAVLAHELLHVWIDYNNIKLNRSKLEGFCNLGSYLIYKNDNTQFSSIHLKAMDTSKDIVYGKGYREMKIQLEKLGWEKLIANLSSY